MKGDWSEEELYQEIDDLNAQIKELDSQRTIANQQLSELKVSNENLIKIAERSTENAAKVNSEYLLLRNQLAEKDKEIARLETVVKTYSDMSLRAQDQILEMERQIINWSTLSDLNGKESIAKGLDIIALKQALSKAKLYVLPVHGLYKEIENLLK